MTMRNGIPSVSVSGKSRVCALLLAFVILCLLPLSPVFAKQIPGAGADVGKTVIYRDTWGVAHIYAPTVEAGSYAMGWAQAQDRPHELLLNFLRGIGESARVEGQSAVVSDLAMQMWDNYEVCKRNADKVRPEVRKIQQAYVRGVNDYYAAHPEDVPEWWGDRKVDEYMMLAFARLFLYNWSIEQAFADLARGGITPTFPQVRHGSNQFAVAPSRSAEGAAILAIDPHLSWWGLSRFWEFRIHAGKLNGSGVTLPGFPNIGLGHTDNIAWAMTTGGPDTADIYELTLKADDPSKYLYDGKWRQMTSREVTIEVKDVGPHRFIIYEAHYGPIVAMKDGKAYAAKIAYADCVQASEAWYELNYAKDYRGAIKAAETLQFYPQNLMVADTSGNIYYQRVGRVPRRPDGFDWSRPVNGSTSATEWQGFHPASDNVQILNPPQGYMQNCNVPPDAMMVGSPLTPDKTLPYIYGDMIYGPLNGWTNQRGARAVELLDADTSVTVEHAMSFILDVHPAGVERWVEALKKADDKFGDSYHWNPIYVTGLRNVLSWNGDLDRDSIGALEYYYFRKQLTEDLGKEPAAKMAQRIDYLLASLGKPAPPLNLSDEDLKALVVSFASGMTKFKADHGALDAKYGEVFRVGRGDASWPVGGGGEESLGLMTLRNVEYGPEQPDHTRWGEAGQTSTQIVVLSKPVRSWTALPIGESDRPNSSHYRDQAEKLFSPRKLKPTWYAPEELAGHIESRTVLEHAEAN